MSASIQVLSQPARGVVVDAIADLAAIYDDDVAVAVFRRSMLDCTSFIERTLRDEQIDVRLRTRDVEAGLGTVLGGAACEGRTALIADIAFLAELYRDITGYEELGLRLTSSERPMCPRFHVDNVTLRLICTYSGPGTEWLDDAMVDRRKLGPGAKGLPDCSSGIMRPGAVVQRMNTFDIGLFKGRAWQGFETRGAVHRSPDAPDKRLVLSIDGVD